MSTDQKSPTIARSVARPLVPVAIGAAVAITLGMYGRMHEPAAVVVNPAVFSSVQSAKVWATTGVAVLAIVQLLSAVARRGGLPGVAAQPWMSTVHRWSGRFAFLLAVPVAVHCLYAMGFQFDDARTLLHSAFGCLFFGAFTVKMHVVSRAGPAGWMAPAVGGVVFAVLIGAWFTSSLWFFTTFGVRL